MGTQKCTDIDFVRNPAESMIYFLYQLKLRHLSDLYLIYLYYISLESLDNLKLNIIEIQLKIGNI